MAQAIDNFFTNDATVNVVHPSNQIIGGENYRERLIQSLQGSFSGLHRNDYLLMGGEFESQKKRGRIWTPPFCPKGLVNII